MLSTYNNTDMDTNTGSDMDTGHDNYKKKKKNEDKGTARTQKIK